MRLIVVICSILLLLIAKTQAKVALSSPVPQARLISVLGTQSLGKVNTIMQDKSGLMWLGTNDGLIRFDGYTAKRFVNRPGDSQSLSHNKVMSIVQDNEQNLWISTYGGGLNLYRPQTGYFTKVDLRLEKGDRTVTDFLYSLFVDAQNTLWIGSESGLKRLDLNTRKTINLPAALSTLPRRSIVGVFIDSKKQIWISTAQDGVFLYDNQQLQHFTKNPYALFSISSNKINTVIEDPQGNIWLGTGQGLNQFDAQNNSFHQLTPSFNSAFKIPNNDIKAIQWDNQGRLWLGTESGGVHLYTPKTGRFTAISGDRDLQQQQFRPDRINAIFADKEGTLWFATGEGIIQLTKTALSLKYLSNSKATMDITDIKSLNSGEVVFSGDYQFYDYDLNTHKTSSRFVDKNRLYRISQDKENNLWFATLGQGLQQFSATNNQLLQIEHAKPRYSQTPIVRLFDTYIDTKERVWVLPFPDLPHLAGGIMQFDPQTGAYQTYLSSPFISDALLLYDNQLLLSSDSAGLISLNIDTKVATRWQQTIPSTPRRIFTLFKDSQANLWLGTREHGLARFNLAQQDFTFYTTNDGLISNDIVSIVEDDNHNLWLGSPKGLSRFDPITEQVMNIEKRDGLLFDNFYKRSAAKTQDGKLLMGTHSGLVTIDPDDFASETPPISVFISDFKLFNQSVDWQSGEENAVLKKPIAYTDAVVLSHEDNMFSFDFAALEYIRPDSIRFAYKMEGLNKKWLYTDSTNRVASYTTLPSGEFTFKVKATNRAGVWNEQATSVKVTILAPWWLTWPAYIAYFIAALTTVFLYIKYRTQKLMQRSAILEENVAQRTRELKTSRDQITDLLAQKQQLFASVSHEFRTPLTLILSPIDYLLGDEKGQHITKELSLIKRSGRRLLRMVDQLLEFAKLEMHDNSQMEPVSLKQTLDIIVSSFERLVKSKNIGLTVLPYKDATLNMLPDSLNKILINILSNAFKYSPQNSQITVTVSNWTDKVEIAIKDTGIGISEGDLELVFQRFNRAIHAHGEAVPGAGIGLALVKELVEANHGVITLTSTMKVGSTFTVTLPALGTNALLSQTDSTLNQVIHEHLDLEIDSVNAPQNTLNNTNNSPIAKDDDQRKSLLIVDDNPDLRDLLYHQLSGKYHCLLAENGQVGLDIAREHLPDMVISDVMMPIMDGYQLTQSLKNDQLTSHIPVILLTAKGSMESRLKGLQLLVDDYLAKPFNIEELTLRVHNILTIRDIIKQKFKQVIDEVNPQKQMDSLHINDVEQAFIRKVNEQLSANHTDAEFSAKLLCRELGVSERQLQRKLKTQFDLGFPELMRNYRLNKAVEMLSAGQKVSQIYHIVGFSSHSYFSSCFKAKFGRTPKEYQQN